MLTVAAGHKLREEEKAHRYAKVEEETTQALKRENWRCVMLKPNFVVQKTH